jgi:hypothetical protein
MSNMSSGITGSAASVIAATQYTASDVSPDMTLEYCAFQLNGIDGELATQMNDQNLQLAQREAVENAQDTLESFGTTGPQNVTDFQTCENAITKAAASLPPGDPVAAQLTQFGQQIAQQYGYTAPQALTPQETQSLGTLMPLLNGSDGPAGVAAAQVGAQMDGQGALVSKYLGSLTNKPANNDWQGTTDTLGTMADGIKSDSEIQMMQVQNLVSQQQQAVQMASGMLSTENQTLDDIAKNMGG